MITSAPFMVSYILRYSQSNLVPLKHLSLFGCEIRTTHVSFYPQKFGAGRWHPSQEGILAIRRSFGMN